jgi:DNA-binding PadR family transcriptional regulator
MAITNPDHGTRLRDILYKDLYSGLIRLHILHHAAEEAIFGFGMMEELARHGYRLSPGTIYPILHSLEKRSLLHSSEVWLNGHRRRVYRATPLGRKALKAAKEKVKELFGELIEHDRRGK